MWCVFKGHEDLQPEQRDPLPSYLDYRSNTSVKSYQTGYFPSMCAESPDSSFQLSLGTGMETLGGSCEDRQLDHNGMKVYCDGPLKPSTPYRYFILGLLQFLIFDAHSQFGDVQCGAVLCYATSFHYQCNWCPHFLRGMCKLCEAACSIASYPGALHEIIYPPHPQHTKNPATSRVHCLICM